MGNHQSGNLSSAITTDSRSIGFVARRRQKLEELKRRRQSMPLEQKNRRHNNFTSLALEDREVDEEEEEENRLSATPRIQITEPIDRQKPTVQRGPSAESMNSPPKRNRFVRNPKSAAARRMEFLSFGANFVVRSLDESHPAFSNQEDEPPRHDVDMKPLSHRARSLSPLKQMRTYSARRIPSDENVLTPEHCQAIRESWKTVNKELALRGSASFGFLTLKRLFEKMPILRSVFGVDEFPSLEAIPPEHSFVRHTSLLQSIIDLAVRNIDELETEIAPALFTYGKRHFQHNLNDVFNEETVRLFCGQVVCTVLDVLGDTLSTDSMEAWIEFMRFLGRALLSGYEYERLAKKKHRFAINTKDRAFFLA